MDQTIDQLVLMGFSREMSTLAIESCGKDASIENMVDYLVSSLSTPPKSYKSTKIKSKYVVAESELPTKKLCIDLRDDDMTPDTATVAQGEGLITLLSYNVWFAEEVALLHRMKGISNIIQHEKPNIICLQEVTQLIYQILSREPWWSGYSCSLDIDKLAYAGQYFVLLFTNLPNPTFKTRPYQISEMGRDLVTVTCPLQHLIIGTTHLESPTPPRFNEKERMHQIKQAFTWLEAETASNDYDILMAGDLNWCEYRTGKQPDDGEVPLPPQWIDTWTHTHPRDAGYTYDSYTNAMLKGNLHGRLDRCLCKLSTNINTNSNRLHLELGEVQLVGKDTIPDVTYEKSFRGNTEILPVLPSDHYGLLVKFVQHRRSTSMSRVV
eukprot:gene9984-20763_t